MWSCGLSGPGGLAQFRHTDSGTGLLAAGTGSGSAKGLRISGLVGNASMTRTPPPAANPRTTANPPPRGPPPQADHPRPPEGEQARASRAQLQHVTARESRVVQRFHAGTPPKKLGSVDKSRVGGPDATIGVCLAPAVRASVKTLEFEVSEKHGRDLPAAPRETESYDGPVAGSAARDGAVSTPYRSRAGCAVSVSLGPWQRAPSRARAPRR